MAEKAMIIAGSDSCSGAGIQVDLKTFSSFGIYATTVLTLLTAQNTTGIIKSSPVNPQMVTAQIDAVMTDIGTDAIKIGVLPTIECVEIVCRSLIKYKPKNIVIDPVLIATTGHIFGGKDVTQSMMTDLFPLVDLVTPNISETEKLSGIPIKTIEHLKAALQKLKKAGTENILATGWIDNEYAVDVLFDGSDFQTFQSPQVKNANVHGAGCTFSSAIAASLALGFDMVEAIWQAKVYVTRAIQNSLTIGSGLKVLNHFPAKERER